MVGAGLKKKSFGIFYHKRCNNRTIFTAYFSYLVNLNTDIINTKQALQ